MANLPLLSDLRDPAFWLALNPHLHVDGSTLPNAETSPQQSYERLRKRMLRDGYFGESDQDLATSAIALRDAIEVCDAAGLPPVFAWVYDEPWACFRRLAPVISSLLGADFKALPDFWAWRVDPARAEGGWRPHRDKANRVCIAADGSPLSLTCWIPLTEANPLNSCMYIVPAHLDQNYNKPGVATETPIQFSCVRALPARPGDYLIWNQAVLHWGSHSSEFAESPRLSMALEFQRGDIPAYNAPLLDLGAPPAFAERLQLIGKQLLQYRHMYGYSDALTAVASDLQGATSLA